MTAKQPRMSAPRPRQLDLVIYGASGFTGQLVCRYVRQHAPAGLRWALAGRDAAKLERIAAEPAAKGETINSEPVAIIGGCTAENAGSRIVEAAREKLPAQSAEPNCET